MIENSGRIPRIMSLNAVGFLWFSNWVASTIDLLQGSDCEKIVSSYSYAI